MELDRQARELFFVGILTDPPITAWEASFDDGETYVAGEAEDGGWRWLLAGEDADPTGAAAVITSTRVRVKVRAVDNPEIIVRTEEVPLIRYRR